MVVLVEVKKVVRNHSQQYYGQSFRMYRDSQQLKGWDSKSRDGTATQGMGQQIKGWDQVMGQ